MDLQSRWNDQWLSQACTVPHEPAANGTSVQPMSRLRFEPAHHFSSQIVLGLCEAITFSSEVGLAIAASPCGLESWKREDAPVLREEVLHFATAAACTSQALWLAWLP